MIFEKVRDIICDKFGLEEDKVTPETSFRTDLSADSLDMVELIMALEEEFGLGEIGEEAISGIDTVADVVKYITENT